MASDDAGEMKIYTRFGDGGQTRLIDGDPLDKSALIVQWIGAMDELNSTLGVATAHELSGSLAQRIEAVQRELFEWGAVLAGANREGVMATAAVERLESEIDEWQSELPAMTHFILPGGSIGGATLHLARCVCRRVERVAAEHLHAERGSFGLDERDDLRPFEELQRYLNRLSDWLFVAARWENKQRGVAEQKWEPRDESAD